MRLLLAGVIVIGILHPADLKWRKKPDWLPFSFQVRKALAHDWYPASCCSGHDCHPIETDELIEQADGSWVYLPTKTVFPKDKIHPSRDNKFHVCIGTYEFNKGQPLCAFILQGS